jgi:hypothetical protein
VLRGALRTDDGRAILREALGGQLAWRPDLPDALDTRRVYPDLGAAEPDDSLMARNAVFVTARFRTGSTLLWNIFRHVPGVTAYYEPLNERRWFDSHRSLLGFLNLRDYDLDQLIELVVPPQQRRWEYAPAEWFAEREAQCEQTLAEFLRPDDATFGSSDQRSHPMLVARGTVSSPSVAETPYH